MSSNSTEAGERAAEALARAGKLADEFWHAELVPLGAALRRSGASLARAAVAPSATAEEKSATSWQPSSAETFSQHPQEALQTQLERLWAGEPELLARVDAVVKLAAQFGELSQAEAAELSTQMYVMF